MGYSRSRIEKLKEIVSFEFEITIRELMNATRRKEATEGRAAICWLAREYYDIRQKELADELNISRRALNNALRRYHRLKTNEEFKDRIEFIKSTLKLEA